MEAVTSTEPSFVRWLKPRESRSEEASVPSCQPLFRPIVPKRWIVWSPFAVTYERLPCLSEKEPPPSVSDPPAFFGCRVKTWIIPAKAETP